VGPAHVERELKFTPSPDFDLATALGEIAGDHDDGVVGDESLTKHLHAVYFDTADLRLARSGASLRYRDDGWTVKLPSPSGVELIRRELHVDGPPGDPPDAVVDLVHALIRHAPLHVAAHLDTVRTSHVVREANGAVVAEAVDDVVSVHDGVCPDGEFREIEVEFADDVTKKVVTRIATRLEDAGAGSPQLVPKIVRALGPRALAAPDLAGPPKLDFASTATEVLRAAIIRSTARLLAHDPGVRLGSDPEDVHQARVATRRLRSDLRTFRAVVDPAWDEPLRDELRWLGGLLGAVRDADVLLGRLEAHTAALPPADRAGGAHLLDGLHAQRAHARDELLAAMRSSRYTDLIERLLAASRAVPALDVELDLELDLGELVAKPWKKLRKTMEALGEDPPDPELHAARIRAKRARYAAEAVAPAIGKDASEFASAVAELQEVLGEHQDAVVAGQWLRSHVPSGEGAPLAAFVAGELAAREDVAAQESREAWPDVWDAARRAKLRRWM
jgi:CHAD domain-containing protein